MTSLLVEWVNDELQLEPPLTEETLAEELGSGFILGALLHRHNQLAEHERLRRRDTADARIENFCVLEPTLASLGVRFDANAALGIMNAKPGAAAMVLYQLKVQLEKLAKEAQPVSLRERRDGVRPLPNMPKKLKKQQFDTARAQLFEAQIRSKAENPNITMERKVLARFGELAEREAAKRVREQERSFALLDQHREATRTKRIYERQQEAAFLQAWEARGLEHWAANRRERKHNEKRDEIFQEKELRKAVSRVEKRIHREATYAFNELDNFERRLQEQKALEVSVAPKAIRDVVDRKDPLAESARATAAVVDIGVGVGSEEMERDVVLDARALRAERDAQDADRRAALAERTKREDQRAQRRMRFVTEREAAQVQEYHAHRAAHLQAQLTKTCDADKKQEEHLALVAKHKARMAESRAFREAQYKTRRDLDTEDFLRRDQERLDEDIRAYNNDLDASATAAKAFVDASTAASDKSVHELCSHLVHRIARGALEICSLRDEERAGVPEQQQQSFLAKHTLLENDGDPCDPRTFRDHARVVCRIDGAMLGFEYTEDDDMDCLERAFTDQTTQSLCAPETYDRASGPPRWDAGDKLEEKESVQDVADKLDGWDAQDYIRNEPPFHFSTAVAEAEVRGITGELTGAAKRWKSADEDEEEADDSFGALRRRQQALLEAADAAAATKTEALATMGEKRSAEHSLGEAILDCRFAAVHEEVEEEEFVAPPEFPLRICLAGRTFAGKSEQASRLADRFRLKVLSAGGLLEKALKLSEDVTLGKVQVQGALAELAKLGRQATQLLREGQACDEATYAALIVAGIKEIAEQNEQIAQENEKAQEKDANTLALEAYLREVFDRCDSDGGGDISIAECIAALKGDEDFAEILNVDRESFLDVIWSMDSDGDGTISWDEFRSCVLNEPDLVEPYNGWVLEDYPETVEQCSALEKALTGYDSAKIIHTRWDHPSELASIAPPPVAKYSGFLPDKCPSRIESGVDLVFHLPVDQEQVYRRCLGRRIDDQVPDQESTIDEYAGAAVKDERAMRGEYHLDSNLPDYGASCKARLRKVEDPQNPTASLPFQLESHDTHWKSLSEFLERFGNLREVSASGLTEEGAFGCIVPIVDEMLSVRSAAAKEKKVLRDAQVEAYDKIVAELTAAKEAAEAVLAEAVAAAPAPAEEAEATEEAADEAVAAAETAVQEAASKLAECEAKGPFYTEPVEESVVEDPEALTPLSKEAGSVLSEMWGGAEQQFFDGTKKAFRSLREMRSQIRRQHYVLRQDFARYLARPDDRQDLLKAFVEDFNSSIPMDMRVQDATKAELHLRAVELHEKLNEVQAARETQAKSLWAKIRLDGSLQSRQASLSKSYACLAQCEVDRTHSALCLLKDYYAASYPVGEFSPEGEDDEPAERQKLSDGCGALAKRTADFVEDEEGNKALEASEDALPPNILEALFGDPFVEPTPPEEEEPEEETEPPPEITHEDMERELPEAEDCLVSALEAARTWALSFAAPDSAGKDSSGQPGLREAIWQQAELLLARCKRIEDSCVRDRKALAKRRDQILSELKDWTAQRIEAELQVNEGLVELIRQHIEEERPIEDAWEVLGIVLVVDTNKKIIPLQDTLYWRTHPQAAQLVQHPEYCENLPEPPPLPVPPDLPEDRFSAAQKKFLRAQLEDAYLACSQQDIPPPPGYGLDGLPLLPPGPSLKLWVDSCSGAAHVRVTLLRDGLVVPVGDRYYYEPYEIECGSKAMVASYKIQTAAQDLISVRLELLGEKPEAPEATEGEEPVVVEAPVLSTITQPLVFEGGALTLPFEVDEAPEEEAERPASRASRSSKASEPAEEEEEEEAEAPPKEITMRWAFRDPVEPPAPAPAPADANFLALEEYLKSIFDRVDADGTGTISIAEAVRALGDDEEFADIIGADSSDNILQAVRLMDDDGDSKLTWDEFKSATLGEPQMEGAPPQKKWVTRDALVHILANAALHTDKLPGQWQQKTRYFFEDAFLAPQGPLDEDQTGIVYVEDVMALVESWEVLPEVREMPLNDYVAWTDPIAANPAAHPQLGAAGITVGSTEEGGEVTYAEREEGAEEGAGGDYVESDAEGG